MIPFFQNIVKNGIKSQVVIVNSGIANACTGAEGYGYCEETAKKALYTGHIGDGKIFVYDVAKVVKIRTGEEDVAALQDVE